MEDKKKNNDVNREETSKIVEANSLSTYEQDMVKYSIVVDRRRALPEDRDSLKPVQRRVIFDMLEQNATSFAKRIKASATVGDTMKKYHPHGDCIRKNLRVYSLDGNTYTIGDIYESGIPFMHVLAMNPYTGKVIPSIASNFRIGQYTNEVYHIVLSNGEQIECTSNHPIMMNDMQYVQAKDIVPGMIPFRKTMVIRQNNGRPSIDGSLIQDLVYNHYLGELPKGYVKHHKDHNIYNNTPENLDTITRAEHALHHDDYNVGLELGRQSMFDPNGKDRMKTQVKNGRLTKIFNEDQGIRRFQACINKLLERGMEVTPENYESLRGEVYNLPKIDRLIENGYGNSFEDLVNCKLKTIGEIYQEQYGNLEVQNAIYDIEPQKPLMLVNTATVVPIWNVFAKFDNIYSKYGRLDYELYCIETKKQSISEFHFEFYKAWYLMANPVIVNVWVEQVDQEPMYDFTVAGVENMLIPVGNLNNEFIPMMCIHNSSIYGTMEPLANWFKCKVPLIAPKGNWGTIMGDEPAAMRYTEAGLSDFCYECVIGDLKECENVVDWIPNYIGKGKEPEFLPVKVPLLLINGSFGIGVGMAVNIPPHNLVEVINETRALIRDPNHEVFLIPDHCLSCNIIEADFKKICDTGAGSYRVRGIVETTEEDGYPTLIVRSLPDRVTTDVITSKLLEMVEKKQLPMIKRIDDASAKGNVEIIIQLRKGSYPGDVKDVLYAKT